MKKIVVYVLAFILLIVLLYSFSASYSYDNIDNLAYVVAIGIDSTDNGNVKVSFQFTDTSAFSESSSSGDNSTVINTVEASSIESSVNLLNSYIGKNVNLAHCKVIVISEALAKQGVSTYVYSLINDSQIRPTSNIVISRCDAKYYIENSISKYEKIITKYYEVFPNSADYTGYISNVSLGEFFNQLVDKTHDPVAILGGVNSEKNNVENGNENDANILANESTIDGERGTENIGLAVFRDDKLVGELSALEALCRSIVNNEVDTFLVSVPNPKNEKSSLDLSTSQYKCPDIKIDTSNGSPYITVDVYLFSKILSIESDNDYLNNEFLENVTNSTNNYLASRISEYLYKTSSEFRACINNFDKHAMRYFLTNKDWDNYNWMSNYPSSIFDVRVHTKVNSSLLVTNS